MISPVQLSDFFVEMTDTLVGDFDILDFYHNLTKHAAAVSGASAAGLVLSDHRGRVRYVGASNESGKMLELLQIQNSEGPCLDCVTTGEPVINADLSYAMDRWPVFSRRAIEAGFQSVHAFPMRLRNETIGALNLFGTDQLALRAGRGPGRPGAGRRRHDRDPAGAQRHPRGSADRAAPGRAEQPDRDRAGQGRPRAVQGHLDRRGLRHLASRGPLDLSTTGRRRAVRAHRSRKDNQDTQDSTG